MFSTDKCERGNEFPLFISERQEMDESTALISVTKEMNAQH